MFVLILRGTRESDEVVHEWSGLDMQWIPD